MVNQSKNQSDGFKTCQNPSCPTPNEKLKTEDIQILDSQHLCLFCFTKLFAERHSHEDFNLTTTKKVSIEKISRIKPVTSFFSTITDSPTTTRIPSSDTHLVNEELDIWKEVFPSLILSRESDIGQIKSFSTIINSQGRIIHSSDKSFFVAINDGELKGEILLNELNAMVDGSFYKTYYENISDLSFRSRNWFKNRFQLENQKLKDYKLKIFEFNEPIHSLNDINFESKPKKFLKSFAYSLGSYVYRSWLFGIRDPLLTIVVARYGKEHNEFISISTNEDYKPFSQSIINSVFQSFGISLPFILEEEVLTEFYSGSENEKKTILQYLEDHKFKSVITQYFNEINADMSILDSLSNLPEIFLKKE